MRCAFWPKDLMISDFGPEKLPNSEMMHFLTLSEFDGKKLFHFVFTVNCYSTDNRLLELIFTDFWG